MRDRGVQDGEPAVMSQHAPSPAPILVRASGRRRQRDRQLLPVHQVTADRVPPVLVRRVRDVRAVLEEDVIGAVPMKRLGIVDPARRRQEVIARALRIARRALTLRGAEPPVFGIKGGWGWDGGDRRKGHLYSQSCDTLLIVRSMSSCRSRSAVSAVCLPCTTPCTCCFTSVSCSYHCTGLGTGSAYNRADSW